MAGIANMYHAGEKGRPGTSINLTNETARILNALKTKRRLPSLEATIEWLFASLDAEGKKELLLITDFLALPPPLINVEEVVKSYSFSKVDFHNAIDVVFQRAIADKLKPNGDPGQKISKADIANVIDDLIEEKIEKGLARWGLVLHKEDITDQVYSNLNKSPSAGFKRVLHDKPGVEHGENSKQPS